MIFLCTDCGELHPMGPNDDECPGPKGEGAEENQRVVCTVPLPRLLPYAIEFPPTRR